MRFIELLDEYDIPTAPHGHHHATEGWIQFDCPFCGRDTRNWHMGYNISGGYLNCWRCGTHSVASVLREYTRFSFKKIKKILRDIDEIDQVREDRHTRTVLELPNGVDGLHHAHIRYLNKRGFDHIAIQRLWQVKGIAITNKLQWRLFIPIYHKGKLVSWTTRSISDTVRQRYISAKARQELIPHKDILYGGDYVRHAAVIVEGPLDAWAVGPGAVATFGVDYSKKQVAELIKIPKRIICFDSSNDAQKQAKKLMNELGAFDGETLNVVLDADDPAVAKPSELRELRKFLK